MKKAIYIALYICLFSSLADAQSNESSSFQFMLIGAGSRAASLGEAYTAVSGDAGAPYFNPSSAAMMNRAELSFMHVKYLTDVSMEHFTFLSRSGNFHFGFGFYYGQTSDIQRRSDTPSDNPLGTFNEHNFTASFIWAVPVSQRFAFGNSIKWAYEKLDLESASALALDLGAFYTLTPEIALGLSVRNLGTRPKFVSEAFDLPRELRIGASYRGAPKSKLDGFMFSSDFVLPNWGDKSSKFNLGAEYNYQNLLMARLGYDIGYDSRGFSIGGGLAYRDYYFDYAFVPAKHNLSDTHRLTLRVRL
jgi:hypothetical protein